MIQELVELYNRLKNHPYVNEITLKNGKSFHKEYSLVYKYLFGANAEQYRIDYANRTYNIPELTLLATESHDINMMCGQLDSRYHTDGDELNKIHHSYMMEILTILGSLAGEKKVEYINIYKYVLFTDGYKWKSYLYKVKEVDSNIFKSINCISETYVKDKLISKYQEAINKYRESGNEKYAKFCEEELDDLINKTELYHIILSDEEFYNYKK